LNSNRLQPVLGLFMIFLILVASSSAPGQVVDKAPKNQLDKDIDIANSLIRIGDFERALSFLSYIVKTHGKNHQVVSLYKLLYSEAKMYPELEKLIYGQLAENPGNPLLLAELANVKFLLNDRGVADSLWNLALDKGGASQSVYIYVAGYKLRYGDYDGAAAAFIRGRTNFGNPSLFAAQLAGIYESKREYSRATHEYLVELNQNPKELSAISARIQGFLEDADNPDEIIAAVRRGIKEFPQSQNIHQVLGDLYIQKGEMKEALETYRILGRERKDDGASLYRFAEHCYGSRAFATTITAVEEYLQISRNAAFKEPAQLLKGKAQRAAGLIDGALSTLASLSMSAANPEIRDTSGYLVGAIFAVDMDDCRQAVANWRNLIQRISTPGIENEVRVEMASCLIRMEKPELAESLLTQAAINRKPDEKSERSLFLLGELAFFKSEYDRAKEIYSGLARQYPGGYFANNALERLIIINAENTGDGYSRYLDRFAAGAKMQASGHLREAAGIFSDSIFYFSSIAEQAEYNAAAAYAEAGESSLAIESFKRYIDTYPDGFYTDRAYLNLGDLYMENAETLSLARSAYNKILEVFSEGPVTEPARERLKRLEARDEIG
jgi:tetratricopeptide (TPR) repeat protein